MKVAILTITDGCNYGNRLQNYALQNVLEELGCEVETLRRGTLRDKTGFSLLKQVMKNMGKTLLGREDTEHYKKRRYRRFQRFNRQYISFSKDILHDNVAPEGLAEQFDYFICGSDQIWNAYFEVVNCDLKNHLAFFAKPEQRVSYAASFGTNDIAPGYEHLFCDELSKFKAIGVREASGINIVKKYCDRDDGVEVLDPTLLISSDKWKKIASKPGYMRSGKYIVTYFLGGKSDVMSTYIQNISNQYRAKVINLDIEFKQDNEIENKDSFTTTPDEFIWLIANAECVLTDSFHGTIFAILFNKPFAVFQRVATEKGNEMGGRINALLKKFGLTQFYGDIDNPQIYPQPYSKDYIDLVLQIERNKSISFLKNSLGIL